MGMPGRRKESVRSGPPAVNFKRLLGLRGAALTACDLGLCVRAGLRSGVSLR
jgi:hypothetical protein